MILNRYDRVMEHVEVSAEMRDRILKNLEKTDFGKKQSIVLPFVRYRKYIAIAACFVLLLVGAFAVRNMIDFAHKPPTQVVPDIAEYGSLGKLSEAVGFKVREVRACPFNPEQITYTAYWKTMAQIVYAGKDDTLVFRMSAGTEDVSGDYNEYSDVKDCSTGGITVTIKGDDGQYNLAVWESEGYSYSVSITNGIPEKKMLEIVQSVR